MKALFVPFAPSLAHVSRCLAVAEAWRSRGHEAIFAVGRERLVMVRQAGFEAQAVPEVAGAVFRADRGFRWLTPEYFQSNLDVEREMIDRICPDVVLFDFRFTTASSARLANVPAVSILHGNGLRLALWPAETARCLVGDPRAVSGVAALRLRIIRRMFPLGFQAMLRMVARRVAPVTQAHGLPPASTVFELLLGDRILLADIRELLPEKLPPNAHIVGPLVWSGWGGSAPWLEGLDARPLVYVTMGSTVDAQASLVKIIRALRDGPYNVAISSGSLSLPPGLTVPEHVHIRAMVPGATVVQRSSLVLYHGGHGTLLQALAAGVPSLILPTNPDQVLVAQQAQALGVGRSLWQPGWLPTGSQVTDRLTTRQIRQAVDDLFADQDCRQTCRAFKAKIVSYRGAAAAADILADAARATGQID